jgi:hypothetical protein
VKNLIVLYFSLSIFLSCKEDQNNFAIQSSRGKLLEILVVADTSEMDHVKNILLPLFNENYDYLPQREAKYSLKFISLQAFLANSEYLLFHNTLFINQNERFGLRTNLQYAKAINKWANPQLLQFVKLDGKINETLFVVKNEIELQNLNLFKSRTELWKIDTLLKFANQPFIYPIYFEKQNLKDSSIYLYKHEFKDGVECILLQKTKMKPNKLDLIKWRNQIFEKYFSGSDSSIIVHDKIIKPDFVSLNGQYLKYSLKGLWETKADFKGGPFVTYIFYDQNNQEYLLADSFVFCPGKGKKNYVEELKLIILGAFEKTYQ